MIHNNIKDLMTPFKSKSYYTSAMKGSYSIKYVLQALVPEITKSYKDLDGVQNGSDAMQIYAKLSDTEDKEKVVQFRDALLEYCKLDTFAMVEILKKLKETIN
jgi:patatin-like phospholipase/acyl hydrolase